MEAVLEQELRDPLYSKLGLILNNGEEIIIDLSRSRSFRVKGLTVKGEWREYLLRVSDSGKLSLV